MDQENNTLIYKGKVVGRIERVDGSNVVSLRLDYSDVQIDDDHYAGPIAELGRVLRALEPPKETVLTVETTNEDFAKIYPARQSLMEFWLKTKGYKWDFHKNDVDPWPSKFHAHDYAKHLKLDVITGVIFDVGSKEPTGKLNAKTLAKVHAKVRKTDALKDLAATYLPKPPKGKPKARKKPPQQQQR